MVDLGSRQRLARGGDDLVPVKECLEQDITHPQQGGSGAAGVRLIFLGLSTGGTTLQSGDLGGHPPHGQGPGGVSDPSGETADGAVPVEYNVLEVEIHLFGGGKGGGGVLDDGGIR